MKLINVLFLTIFLTLLVSCETKDAVVNSYAKDYCSCTFIMKQSENYCHKHANKAVKINRIEVDKESKSVTASFMGVTRVAQMQDPQYGCQLEI